MKQIALFSCLVLLSVPAAGYADDDDQDRARAALEAGRILPLSEILRRIETEAPGRVIEVDYDEEDGRAEYEIEILQADGRLLELEVDAATAEILDRDYEDDD